MSNESSRASLIQQTKVLQREIKIQQNEILKKYNELNKLYQKLETEQVSVSNDTESLSGHPYEENRKKTSLENTNTNAFSQKTIDGLKKYKAPERVKWWRFFWK
ncbi:hypothetical protein JCM15457_406 [Liquorilactobacillus sucicola DSM 21376 = JCM 15457]|uniref:Uncharacterized protein n=1 Tax=Liquorilactobacillus sucicola DSM 21376 = JCM 15457 TaxID=1423806 RepID=A0A023CUP3_9LACO|nr:hypothetical protein [Liquorilactobacillus sucicola]KRN05461.1 hypothetical protein FD15_GL002016 [Liquorilactobacillus sucicola DSM 21376 = JCM 15457]GAJ25539.1 hypothetical protein JCM15457_406 [Liquorilactobacillus sucicola DSM 21376 = JCM 15457]